MKNFWSSFHIVRRMIAHRNGKTVGLGCKKVWIQPANIPGDIQFQMFYHPSRPCKIKITFTARSRCRRELGSNLQSCFLFHRHIHTYVIGGQLCFTFLRYKAVVSVSDPLSRYFPRHSRIFFIYVAECLHHTCHVLNRTPASSIALAVVYGNCAEHSNHWMVSMSWWILQSPTMFGRFFVFRSNGSRTKWLGRIIVLQFIQ